MISCKIDQNDLNNLETTLQKIKHDQSEQSNNKNSEMSIHQKEGVQIEHLDITSISNQLTELKKENKVLKTSLEQIKNNVSSLSESSLLIQNSLTDLTQLISKNIEGDNEEHSKIKFFEDKFPQLFSDADTSIKKITGITLEHSQKMQVILTNYKNSISSSISFIKQCRLILFAGLLGILLLLGADFFLSAKASQLKTLNDNLYLLLHDHF